MSVDGVARQLSSQALALCYCGEGHRKVSLPTCSVCRRPRACPTLRDASRLKVTLWVRPGHWPTDPVYQICVRCWALPLSVFHAKLFGTKAGLSLGEAT